MRLDAAGVVQRHEPVVVEAAVGAVDLRVHPGGRAVQLKCLVDEVRAEVEEGAAAGGALSVLGEYKYVIPLNKGKHAYVRNLTNGKTVHHKTDSDAFVEEIRVLAGAGHGAKVRAELVALAGEQHARVGVPGAVGVNRFLREAGHHRGDPVGMDGAPGGPVPDDRHRPRRQ